MRPWFLYSPFYLQISRRCVDRSVGTWRLFNSCRLIHRERTAGIQSRKPCFIFIALYRLIGWLRRCTDYLYWCCAECTGGCSTFYAFFFYSCIVPMGFLPSEIRVAFPRESQPRQSRYQTYCACWVFQCFHNPSNSDIDYGIFNVHTDENTCDCTRGVYGYRKRVCTESWL